jgi:hypothetical protein
MKYCVYITEYFGDKLPSKYIGSSSIERVKSGYRGSVSSKKWKDIWKKELCESPNLFSTTIISIHDTREEALSQELKLQRLFDVVKSSEWINESFTSVEGFFGRDVSGENNPMFRRGELLSKWYKENPKEASQKNRSAALTQWSNPKTRNERISSMKGVKKTRKTQTDEEYRKMQKEKANLAKLKTAKRIHYKNRVYIGWKEFTSETGISKYMFIKNKLGYIE